MLRRQLSMLPDEVPDEVYGDVRDKIMALYDERPEIIESDRVLILSYWELYDNLPQVLGEKWASFVVWWSEKATNTESIRRSRQSLTENHRLPQSQKLARQREWMERVWRRYWGAFR